MNSSSKTNWERFDARADDDIDTSDSPVLSDEFFGKAQWLMPEGSSAEQRITVEIQIDKNLLAWFQEQGQDYERRMRAALRLYAEAHRASA